MTLLVAGIGTGLTLILAILSFGVVEVSADRTRAQSAADAAALAAVAEAGPYGGGAPEKIARRFAGLNGAVLVDCRCPTGATAVQVEVELDDVTAQARAVIDPDLLMPSRDRAAGLDPRLQAAIDQLIDASRGAVHVGSGFRSSEEQARLWTDALARYGSPEVADDWVAPPGRSRHERGLAVDLGGDIELALRLIERLELPLWRPMAHEPWHVELTGSRR